MLGISPGSVHQRVTENWQRHIWADWGSKLKTRRLGNHRLTWDSPSNDPMIQWSNDTEFGPKNLLKRRLLKSICTKIGISVISATKAWYCSPPKRKSCAFLGYPNTHITMTCQFAVPPLFNFWHMHTHTNNIWTKFGYSICRAAYHSQPSTSFNSGWWCNNHLEKSWSSSMGRMTSHILIYIMENKSHVWNHQPEFMFSS